MSSDTKYISIEFTITNSSSIRGRLTEIIDGHFIYTQQAQSLQQTASSTCHVNWTLLR